MLFKLREAIVAVGAAPEGGQKMVTIPHGAVLELAGEPQQSGLVDVLWAGRHLAVFIQDIKARAGLVSV
jgi:hypothetical protein